MKMAKPSARDLIAAGDLMSLLDQVDRGDYPGDQDGAPDFFDPDNRQHLRAFYDAVMATMETAPGYVCRVIGGMCYVIMYDKNEIIDPNSDVIDLHPKLAAAQVDAARYQWLRDKACDMGGVSAPMCAMLNEEGAFKDLIDGVELDAAIDAAIATMQQSTTPDKEST